MPANSPVVALTVGACALLAFSAHAQFFPQVSEGTLIVHTYDPQRLVVALDTSTPPDGRVDEHVLVDLADAAVEGLERGALPGRVELHEGGLLVRAKGQPPLAFVLRGERERTWAVPADARVHVAVAIVKEPARPGLSLAQTAEQFDARALDSEVGAERRITEGVRASRYANWQRIRRTFESLPSEVVEQLRATRQLHLFQQDPPGDPGGGSCSPACYVACGPSGSCSGLCAPGLCATCSCVDAQPWCGCIR